MDRGGTVKSLLEAIEITRVSCRGDAVNEWLPLSRHYIFDLYGCSGFYSEGPGEAERWATASTRLKSDDFNVRRLSQILKKEAYGTVYYHRAMSDLRELAPPPSPEDILACLISDASCVHYGETHKEFAADFGYDIDSIKGRDAFRACVEVDRALTRSAVDWDELIKWREEYDS